MNKDQRKILQTVQNNIDEAKCRLEAIRDDADDASVNGGIPFDFTKVVRQVQDEEGALDAANSDVDEQANDERDKFDNLSESLQQADKGQAIEQAADNLDSARDSLGSAMMSISGLINEDEASERTPASTSDEIESALGEVIEYLEEAIGYLDDAING